MAVAESGIRDGDDARRLADAGYDAILVGETLVRAGDRAAELRSLIGHPVGAAMSDDFFVKICGITSEADALLAVSLGASAIGFIFAPSPRQVSVQLAGDIAKRLPEHVLTVGVFRDEAPQRVAEAIARGRTGRSTTARSRDGRGDHLGAQAGADGDQGVPGRRACHRTFRRVRGRLPHGRRGQPRLGRRCSTGDWPRAWPTTTA